MGQQKKKKKCGARATKHRRHLISIKAIRVIPWNYTMPSGSPCIRKGFASNSDIAVDRCIPAECLCRSRAAQSGHSLQGRAMNGPQSSFGRWSLKNVLNGRTRKSKTLQARIVSGSFVLLSGSSLATAINLAYNIAVARFLGPKGFGHATAVYTLLTLALGGDALLSDHFRKGRRAAGS